LDLRIERSDTGNYHTTKVKLINFFFSPEVVPYKFEDKLVEVKQISSGMHHSVLLSKDGNTYYEKQVLIGV
jgi:alpha-tubulin suppressor-like RCC1 family protein